MGLVQYGFSVTASDQHYLSILGLPLIIFCLIMSLMDVLNKQRTKLPYNLLFIITYDELSFKLHDVNS